MSDIWKFNGVHWSWIGGSDEVNVVSNSSFPGSIASAALWKRSNGEIYLYGGTRGNFTLGELWKVRMVNKDQLEFVSEGGNCYTGPLCRSNPVTWLDSNENLWLFGGQLDGASYLDLWKYDVNSKEWTVRYGNVDRGTQGVPSSNAWPRGRWSANSWSRGDLLYFFGGKRKEGTCM